LQPARTLAPRTVLPSV